MSRGAEQSVLRRPFFRDLAQDRPGLLAAILRFNARVNPANGDADTETGRWQALFQGANRAKARLEGRYTDGFWDFEEESRRLALLDPLTFERLILYWGAAFCAPQLNQVVLRSEFEALSGKLGPELLAFARGRGRFCIGELSVSLKNSDTADLAVLVPRYGLKAYRICSAVWPGDLKELQEKMVSDLLARYADPGSEVRGEAPAYFRAVWFSVKKILLREVAPEWTPCFS